ncbi:MAG TPA: xanthine dehydrogenase family protein molybdopterin-binding subunit, partial [Thermoanaerobaculia bacterium]
VDGRLKVTGGAKYAAEFSPAGLAHAVLVQSTIARGRIIAIELAEARRSPGVIAILTHENAAKLREPKPDFFKGGVPGEMRLPLSDATIHHAGQHIAVVIADSLEQARRAASLVKVRYREEKPVLEVEEAESTATYPKEFFGEELQHHRGNVDAALAAPGVVKIEQTYKTPVETNNPMEPSATVAEWNGERLTVHNATQWVMGARAILAEAFGIPRENVRVICPFVGGGFGCKGFQWPHEMLAAMAARATGRPVKLVLTRAQMFTSVGHRPPTVQTVALAADKEGRLTAIRHETVQPTSLTTEHVEACGMASSKFLYACPNVSTPHKLLRVNVGAPTPMRAPGECPGTFALESAMDELADALGMDPIELRLRNHADIHPAKGKPWSSKYLKECYAVGAEKFGWKRRSREPRSMREGDLLVGWGMATATYPGYRFSSSAKVRISSDGNARVTAATHDLGTGAYTVFTQVAADALGLPVERVTFELGDTNFPAAPVAGGSNSTASVSEAILEAAAAAKSKLAALASSDPKSLSLTPERISELLSRAGLPSVEAEASVSLDEEKSKAFAFQSFGAQFCEVKIDPLLPRVRVTRFVSVIDNGRVLNPRTSRSQVMGGVTMGIGMALMEHTAYDPRTGRPVTDNFADYAIPVNADVGSIEVELIDRPDPQINTLGCRGIGEIGITGVAAAIANAVYHATGRRVRELPITPDKLL